MLSDCSSLRQTIFQDLMSRPLDIKVIGDPNRPLLAQMIAGRAIGAGALPSHLGLGQEDFHTMWELFFPGPVLGLTDQVLATLPEWDDLHRLLVDHQNGQYRSESWIATILTAACAGKNHLWEDLGLSCREKLTQMLYGNFARLAQKNVHDMKWKKFLYREICLREGVYLCPAPSCSECQEFLKCFAPEV